MVEYNGHLYGNVPVVQTWTSADVAFKAYSCCGKFGHLATISDAAELAFVGTLLTGNNFIGLSDYASEGNLVWTTGEPYDPTVLTFAIGNSNVGDYAFLASIGGSPQAIMTPATTADKGIIEFDCYSN
jgi:Lectin C-type domain